MTHEGRARALLDALVCESSPSPHACERGLAVVESRIVASEGEAKPAVERRDRTRELVRAAGLAIAIAAAVLLVLRLATWSVQSLGDARPHESASYMVEPPRREDAREVAPVESIATPPKVELPSDGAPSPAAPVPARATASTRASTPEPARSDAAPPQADDLAAEAALIREAKSTKDARAALSVLDRHAQRFANGTLSREREMLRAEQLCTLGRRDEARAVAQRFLADGKDDPLARRMRKVCTPP